MVRKTAQFGKMQFLLIGNKFSGVNLCKTRLDMDFKKTDAGVIFTVILGVEIDYMETNDKVKYLQHATAEISKNHFSQDKFGILKDVTQQLQTELVRRCKTSQVFKFLQLADLDEVREEDIDAALRKVLADKDN
jgi:hypothetical protein